MKATNKEIKRILPSGFKLILDREYTLPTDEDVLKVTREFAKDRGAFNWTKESHDCDNASWQMVNAVSGKGWAFALAILEDHAVCLYINDKREVKFIDPYTGEPMKTNKRLKVTVMP